jgi:hypothetical protein
MRGVVRLAPFAGTPCQGFYVALHTGRCATVPAAQPHITK